MDPTLLLGLFNVFAPIISDLITKFRAAHGVDPTSDELRGAFMANITKYLGEGADWKAAHPRPPTAGG